MHYTSPSLISEFMQRDLTANEEAFLIGIGLQAVEKWIDDKLGSHFLPVSETTRRYESCDNNIDIDPCIEITALSVFDSYGVSNYSYQTFEYVLEPINETVKREIRLRSGRFPHGTSNIAVTAKFTEYSDTEGVPNDIQLVATRLAAGILNSGKLASKGGNIQRESLEGHEVFYDTSVAAFGTIADDDAIIKNLLMSRKEILIW